MRPYPGAPRKDFFNKKFYDEQTRAPTHSINAPRATTNSSNVIIEAMLNDDSVADTIEPYSPVVLGVGNFITPSSDLQHLQIDTFKCYTHTEDKPITKFNPTWGIALDFITKSSPGKVQLTGGCWLKTTGEVIIPGGNSFDIFNSKLWRCYGGKADIIGDTPTASWSYVSLTKSSMTWIGKTQSAGLNPGTPGTVDIYEYHNDAYRSTGITKTCITIVTPIVGIKDIEITIKGGMLLALEIC
jgi:hypothetical protein